LLSVFEKTTTFSNLVGLIPALSVHLLRENLRRKEPTLARASCAWLRSATEWSLKEAWPYAYFQPDEEGKDTPRASAARTPVVPRSLWDFDFLAAGSSLPPRISPATVPSARPPPLFRELKPRTAGPAYSQCVPFKSLIGENMPSPFFHTSEPQLLPSRLSTAINEHSATLPLSMGLALLAIRTQHLQEAAPKAVLLSAPFPTTFADAPRGQPVLPIVTHSAACVNIYLPPSLPFEPIAYTDEDAKLRRLSSSSTESGDSVWSVKLLPVGLPPPSDANSIWSILRAACPASTHETAAAWEEFTLSLTSGLPHFEASNALYDRLEQLLFATPGFSVAAHTLSEEETDEDEYVASKLHDLLVRRRHEAASLHAPLAAQHPLLLTLVVAELTRARAFEEVTPPARRIASLCSAVTLVSRAIALHGSCGAFATGQAVLENKGSGGGESGADEVLSGLVFVLLNAPVLKVSSLLSFLKRWRDNLDGFSSYCVTHLQASLFFLLSLSPETGFKSA
jgi:Vacuolar sorting protein 9 (VPS9) domain